MFLLPLCKTWLEKHAQFIAQAPSPQSEGGFFFAPCAYAIDHIQQLTAEHFGPILHLIRYQNDELDSVLNDTDQLVLSGSENGFVYVWDLVEGGGPLNMLNHTDMPDGSSIPSTLTVHSLSFHPKKCELITAAKAKVYVWREPQ